jgi:2-polyprenyl-3-methyl-5-hydroxy-6-metoxy-1,4-benzoquinol methylase
MAGAYPRHHVTTVEFVTSRQLLFKSFYRLGFVPWDGHPLAKSLQKLIEGDGALATGEALDIGCGTGDTSIYLAKHGWQVTGVDFVAKAVDKARARRRRPTRSTSRSPKPTPRGSAPRASVRTST